MDTFNAQDANAAVGILSETALRLQEKLSTFSTVRDRGSSHEENDSTYPYFDQFCEQGEVSL